MKYQKNPISTFPMDNIFFGTLGWDFKFEYDNDNDNCCKTLTSGFLKRGVLEILQIFSKIRAVQWLKLLKEKTD